MQRSRGLFVVVSCLVVALGLASPAAAAFPAPTGFTSTGATSSSLSFNWNSVPDAPLYQVKVSTSSTMTNAKYSWYSASEGTVTGLASGKKYYALVKVVNEDHSAPLGPYSAKISATTAAGPSSDLRVGTFNISGSNNDPKAGGDQKVWSERRSKVVQQIVDENTDILGTQEAFWSTGNSLPSGTTQFTDLRDRLNNAGKPFELTNTNRDVGKGTRIYYNTDTIEKISAGQFKYANQVSGKTDRYLAYGEFRHKASGKRFFFTDTHLSPDSSTVKERQWNELITKIESLNDSNLPVIAVGDYNTSKFGAAGQRMLPKMKSAGFGDVMNQEYRVNPPRNVRAETAVNKWIGSFNDYRRDIRPFSYYTRKDKVGNAIDWVFATNSLRVKRWKVVIDFNASTLRMNGTIPSDHNMISSVITLS